MPEMINPSRNKALLRDHCRRGMVVSNPFLRPLFHPGGRHRHCFHQNSEAKRPLFIAPRPIKLLRRLSTETVPWHCEGGLLGSCLFLAQVTTACNFLEFRIYNEPNFSSISEIKSQS